MATNTKKINLNQMLYNIDMANSKWYNTLDEEEKKTLTVRNQQQCDMGKRKKTERKL